MSQFAIYYSGPGTFPFPLDSSRNVMGRFKLSDYFAITNAGEYRLTVWPKIFTRALTNKDLCERVDLPPVTITFQWPIEPEKADGSVPNGP